MNLTKSDQLDLVRDLLNRGLRVNKKATGRSMLPSIPDGALLELVPVSEESIRKGDVVFFASAEGAAMIHRVCRQFRKDNVAYIQTWGDNNHVPDKPIPISQVYARAIAFHSEGKRTYLSHRLYNYGKFFLLRYARRHINNIIHLVKNKLHSALFQ